MGTLETQVGGVSGEDFLEEEACRGKWKAGETRPAQREGRTPMARNSARGEACSSLGLGSEEQGWVLYRPLQLR